MIAKIDPYDNDTAADWCGDLHDADPSARSAMVRAALTTAALNTGYLEHDEAVSAIAAAAIVASHMPGGDPITSPCAPDFLLAGESLDLDDDLPQLAIDALDRVLGDDSEWRDQWGKAESPDFPQIHKLRAVLYGPPELPGKSAPF
ncbi:DUF4259 domain-containing protein [Micromonospora sp. NPDC048868]|uniref:DUF4259 domain-containing protein n=1 Tax=Micromonospora sp. NPDC048868 TaxID=3364258 RepID=UPI00371FC6A5